MPSMVPLQRPRRSSLSSSKTVDTGLILDAENMTAILPAPPPTSTKRSSRAPRRAPSSRPSAPAIGPDPTDNQCEHLASLASRWSGSGKTVDKMLLAVRKEAADFVTLRHDELRNEEIARQEAANRASPAPGRGQRRGGNRAPSSSGLSFMLGGTASSADPAAAPSAAPPSATAADATPRATPAASRDASPRSERAAANGGLAPTPAHSTAIAEPAVTSQLRPAREHARKLEAAQKAAVAERIAQCKRLAALPSAPTPDDYVALGRHYDRKGEHDRAAATFFQGLFRQSDDAMLAERFRQSVAAISRMRHPDQLPAGSRFLPELQQRRLSAIDVAARRQQPGRSLVLTDLRLAQLQADPERNKPGDISDPYVRVRHGGGAVWTSEDVGTELARSAPRMNALELLIPSLIVHGIEGGDDDSGGGGDGGGGPPSRAALMREALGSRYERATKIAPPLALHLDVLDKDFTNEDDLIGSVPLGPLLEGGGDAGRQEKVELRRADGEKGGVVSFSWRLVRSCEMIDIWQPASGTTPRRDMEPGW